jgi:hypothetical protein
MKPFRRYTSRVGFSKKIPMKPVIIVALAAASLGALIGLLRPRPEAHATENVEIRQHVSGRSEQPPLSVERQTKTLIQDVDPKLFPDIARIYARWADELLAYVDPIQRNIDEQRSVLIQAKRLHVGRNHELGIQQLDKMENLLEELREIAVELKVKSGDAKEQRLDSLNRVWANRTDARTKEIQAKLQRLSRSYAAAGQIILRSRRH